MSKCPAISQENDFSWRSTKLSIIGACHTNYFLRNSETFCRTRQEKFDPRRHPSHIQLHHFRPDFVVQSGRALECPACHSLRWHAACLCRANEPINQLQLQKPPRIILPKNTIWLWKTSFNHHPQIQTLISDHRPASIMMNLHSPFSTIVNHHLPSGAVICHHDPPSAATKRAMLASV